MSQSIPQQHSAHDYRSLIQRWREVARHSGLKIRRYAVESGYGLYVLQSRRLPMSGAIYLSAGIHGDEAGATEGLVRWAEENARRLAEIPLLIFPCLNPWGLVNNIRFDAEGRDLNRSFQHDRPESLAAWKQIIHGRRFALTLTLHEDFDGQGLYIYEVERTKPFWGEELLEVARAIILIEGRSMIDGRKANLGIVRRRIGLKKFAAMGLPEAVYLHLHHADRTFTIETPSEFALDQRVRAHVAVIEECVRRVFPA